MVSALRDAPQNVLHRFLRYCQVNFIYIARNHTLPQGLNSLYRAPPHPLSSDRHFESRKTPQKILSAGKEMLETSERASQRTDSSPTQTDM